jgi:broad specificity phosphatase PhoE
MGAIGELFNVSAQIDSNVSETGSKQISHMREKLDEGDFLVSANIKLVVHSPLIRARETSEGMLGCVAPDTKQESVDRVVETSLLSEMTPAEWTPMYRYKFKSRVAEFESWLSEQREESVVLVGHSEYFRSMLGLKFKFQNCDVWQITFDPSKINPKAGKEANEERGKEEECNSKDQSTWTLPPQWSDLKRVHGGKEKLNF